MGAQLRVYKQKIASAQTTKKITKAMELIAASRIQKAMARVRASSPSSKRWRNVAISVLKLTACGVYDTGGALPMETCSAVRGFMIAVLSRACGAPVRKVAEMPPMSWAGVVLSHPVHKSAHMSRLGAST